MKALQYVGAKKVEVREVPMIPPAPGQARIRVTYCGVCGSDIGIYSGKHPRAKAPLTIGHEFVGVIEEINGEANGLQIGDRVAAYPLLSCGSCYACRTGRDYICSQLRLIGIDLDGGMAEYVNCSTDALFRLPENVPDSVCAVIEPLAVAVHSVRRSKFKPLDSAAVIGAGPIGILIGLVLKDSGASRIVISDISKPRLALCEAFGFETVDSQAESLAAYIAKTTGGEGVNIVYECSGVAAGAAEMTYPVCADGMICLVGVHKEARSVMLSDMHFRELNMTATRVYAKEEFRQTTAYIAKLQNEIAKIVTDVIPLEGSEQVFEYIAEPANAAVKVVIQCEKEAKG